MLARVYQGCTFLSVPKSPKGYFLIWKFLRCGNALYPPRLRGIVPVIIKVLLVPVAAASSTAASASG